MSTETTSTTKLDEVVIGMAEAAFEAVKAKVKETGEYRRGAALSGLLKAAAFLSKPEKYTGGEDLDEDIINMVHFFMLTKGPLAIYELAMVLAHTIETPLHIEDSATDTEVPAE